MGSFSYLINSFRVGLPITGKYYIPASCPGVLLETVFNPARKAVIQLFYLVRQFYTETGIIAGYLPLCSSF
jgi:hypothetical protein